jgi:hypothetical protein
MMSDSIFEIEGARFHFRECITCGVRHAMPAVLIERDRAKGGYRYCPNGHQQGWSTEASEGTMIRRERDRLKQEAARLEEENRQAWAAAASLRERTDKAEKATKRLKKRTSAGTCPCCNRTFGNMAEHMKHQHPEFVEDGGAKVVPIKRKTA